ncbi:CASP-like protein 4B4 [Phalaenopsis equestris]|uniref:CASP-like protein 4B4 n=1 Tax=Phalaenopsis equestris TaxID=78828 RepID=UPI0009E4742C|nr:CASP-like protein 4B4 [Phalaenopsis equestris]
MAVANNGTSKQGIDPPGEQKAHRAQDVEEQHPRPTTDGDAAIASVVQRWKREDFRKKGELLLRALQFLFSLLSFVLMASNKHGDWMNFDRYEEYRYLLAISILVFLYSSAQLIRQVHRLSTGRDLMPARAGTIFDFAADQVAAYMMISALSAAIPMTNRMREGADNLFTDASSASISMAFFAFLALAISALASGYKLSNHSYI